MWRRVSETGCAKSICLLSGISASPFLYVCVYVCVCCIYNMLAPLADAQKLLKGDNFPLITLMRYSAAVLSVISPLLGRTTHTLHMVADCQARRHTLIIENASYEEMKREIRRQGLGGERERRTRQLSPLCNLCIFYWILPWQHSTFFTVPHCELQNQADIQGWQIT